MLGDVVALARLRLRLMAAQVPRAPGADLGQQRVVLHRQAPALVVGEVEVEDVELVQRHHLQVARQAVQGQEVAGDVNVRAAPGMGRSVLDPHGGQDQVRGVHRPRAQDLGRQKLQEGLDRPAEAGRGAG